ncbi:phosphotransferase [Engelhardtia mirabilis]|uniref:Phosphotransferase enzyme family protein n=1 Tax=Engelhardtia mirabilis TaxID=2528011 RepID=A0A518BDK9_9BACT|nr:Phosphotransferase enzyme family protein [Planctomycetes bacterium Pla133]QDU99406.1 Phosphotransferase enzyme family protein [Planctomycetes bacterium Pla86]
MTGLRTYTRDLSLPASLGEPELTPPSPEEVAEKLVPQLAPELGSSAPVELTYARWKPGVATTACYSVGGAEQQRLLVVKLHLDGKAGALDQGELDKRRFGHQHEVELRIVVERGRLAWSFPADRELPGAARVLDIGRFARFFEREGSMPGWRVRRKHVSTELVRYRPESRAVFHMDVRLEGPRGEKRRIGIGARCLRRAVALRTIDQRRRFEQSAQARALAPALLATEARSGLLFEEWLPVDVARPGDFVGAPRAGEALARLHRLPNWEAAATTTPHSASDALPLLRRFPALERLLPELPRIQSSPRAWVHGDFHPDQIGVERGNNSTRLLDLDRLGAGEPLDDLAEWIADAVAEDESVEPDLNQCAGPLLDAYVLAGGEAPAADGLRERVGVALVRRAAAAVRRLEVDAQERARLLVDRAKTLLDRKAPR